jgi:CHAT domain-containing protein
MTTLDQCISRAAAAVKAEKARSATFCAVYEQPGKHGWEQERESVYATSRKLASKFDGAATLISSDVTRAGFEEACQSHVVTFYGHHNFEAANVMDQGLELVSVETPIDESSGSAHNTGGEATNQSILKPDVFTVSDIFSTAIRASHITLIACASASEAVQQGDEPLGTVTALLCAGASSVLGTMWAIESGSGRLFSELFHSRLATAATDGNVVDVAVALQQAIKNIRRNDDTEEPFHWASFVLHGSWFYRN